VGWCCVGRERDPGHGDGDDRQHHLRGPALVARQEGLHEHGEAGRGEDDQERQQRAVVDRGHLDRRRALRE
jgi:hypothetical protein